MTPKSVPTPHNAHSAHWPDELRVALQDAVNARFGPDARVEVIHGTRDIDDSTAKAFVRDGASRPIAFVLASSPKDPSAVAESMAKAAAAKAALGPDAGRAILEPLAEGKILETSYVALPYRRPISESRVLKAIQKWRLRPVLFDWLAEVAQRTASRATEEELREFYLEPLACIADMEELQHPIRQSARDARSRLDAGSWEPRCCLVHGDLWEGNILLPARRNFGRPEFAIIDWPGSLLRGAPIYDLSRLIMALRVGARTASTQVARHCQILQCEQKDAMGYLLAGLGQIGLNLNHFPPVAYRAMARRCFDTLAHLP